ncbi:unnamed protein product [Parnassius apollo]|uniref:(apollo) hypothetical protein n=1 Tax=Parnassius apollo TaxID=110799 RepID=A0A8S3XV63_PARAO|nr:unnamed protein product [Parnassius apollo]
MADQSKVESETEEMPAASNTDPSTEQKDRLIAAVKKEVKHLMEEAVTRKFVYEDSGGVTALCGSVEACLGQGLRRRALGLFKTSSTTALLHKIAKALKACNISIQSAQSLKHLMLRHSAFDWWERVLNNPLHNV